MNFKAYFATLLSHLKHDGERIERGTEVVIVHAAEDAAALAKRGIKAVVMDLRQLQDLATRGILSLRDGTNEQGTSSSKPADPAAQQQFNQVAQQNNAALDSAAPAAPAAAPEPAKAADPAPAGSTEPHILSEEAVTGPAAAEAAAPSAAGTGDATTGNGKTDASPQAGGKAEADGAQKAGNGKTGGAKK